MIADESDSRGSPRLIAKKFLESTCAEWVLALIIVTNMCFIIVEADHAGQCESEGLSGKQCPQVLLHTVMNHVFLGLYTVESLARLFAYGRSFFADPWNPFDLVIVLSGYTDMMLRSLLENSDLSTLRMLRIFRIARLARTIKILRHMPELQALISGFKSAIWAMFCGFFFILFLLLMSAIMTVELVHPVNIECDTDAWCNEAFLNVMKTVLYFFQTLIAGDSWGLCAVPLAKLNPWTLLLFALVLVMVQLGFLNVTSAVIVEKAAEARENDKADNTQAAITRLQRIAMHMDTSNDGTITKQEFIEGVANDSEFQQLLRVLDIDEDDVLSLFDLMDSDHSGDLSIAEFVTTIAKTTGDDLRKQMMFLRLNLTCNQVGTVQKLHKMTAGIQRRIESVDGRMAELQMLLR